MKALKITLFLFIITFAFNTKAQENKQTKVHSIDSIMNACLNNESNYTTVGMAECIRAAQKAWEITMLDYYDKLYIQLDENSKKSLDEAQANWEAYRKSELKFSAQMHQNLGGSMYTIIHAERSYEIVKARALELIDYFDTIMIDFETK